MLTCYNMKKSDDYFVTRANNANEDTSKIISTLPSFCFDFFISIEQCTSELTRLGYARDLKCFFSFLSSKIFDSSIKQITLSQLSTIKSTQIEYFLSYISRYSVKGKTFINTERGKSRKLSSIRKFFQFLFNKDLIASNETTKVKLPKLHQKDIIRLEINEVASILNVAENGNGLSKKQKEFLNKTSVRDVAMLSLFLGTGVRISECVGLNVSDIDFEANAFKITRKGGNQVVLYFSDEVADALKCWIDFRKTILQPNDSQPALFLSLQKKRICPRAVENLVKKFALIASPLKNISPHKLRSTFGTNLYRETKDIYVVADILGHKDVNTTKKHYAAISEDIRRDAAGKIQLR